jgi:hypothetical protein
VTVVLLALGGLYGVISQKLELLISYRWCRWPCSRILVLISPRTPLGYDAHACFMNRMTKCREVHWRGKCKSMMTMCRELNLGTSFCGHSILTNVSSVVFEELNHECVAKCWSESTGFSVYMCLQVSLGRVLKAVIAFKGLMIEWVVVKGHGETLDLWTESRHKVFRKVTENSHAAMLHFSSPTLPELAVRSFMVRCSLCYKLL